MPLAESYVPLPEWRAELGFVANYDRGQARLIRRGFAPADMDDRWALRFDPATESLRAYRSWTGFCIFLIGFADSN